MTAAADAAAATDDYVLGRGVLHSVRLDAQHFLWTAHLGHVMHPSIPLREDVKVADVGCGSGIWLMDLARTVPRTLQLHGFDISDQQFPPRRLWPANVTLALLDSLQDPPPSLTGQYDVVHIRMWASNLRARSVGLLIGSVKKMLKPGGYIQWEEADLVHQHVQPDEARCFEKSMNAFFRQSGIDYSWVHDLPASLRRERFEILQADRQAFSALTAHLCTKTYLLALDEIIEGVTTALRENEDQEGLRTARECAKTLAQLQSQCSQGLVYNWGPVSILAKALDG